MAGRSIGAGKGPNGIRATSATCTRRGARGGQSIGGYAALAGAEGAAPSCTTIATPLSRAVSRAIGVRRSRGDTTSAVMPAAATRSTSSAVKKRGPTLPALTVIPVTASWRGHMVALAGGDRAVGRQDALHVGVRPRDHMNADQVLSLIHI